MPREQMHKELTRLGKMIMRLADKDIFPWLETGEPPGDKDIYRAASIVADRHCGATANPLIRNAQEQRQLAAIKDWLEARGYVLGKGADRMRFDQMRPGTFCFRLNVPVQLQGGGTQVKIPVDVAVLSRKAKAGRLPLLIEAKSAGDFTNTNKRRKEEATKIAQLRANYGNRTRYILFLCGYFDSGYLGYEAAEGIDWVWEHRISDLAKFGL